MGNIITRSFALDLGIQWGLFVIAAALKTEKFYDLAGKFIFIITYDPSAIICSNDLFDESNKAK